MMKFTTHLFAALAMFALAGIGSMAQAQTTPNRVIASTTTSDVNVALPASQQVAELAKIQQIEALQKQLNELKASLPTTTGAIPAQAPQPLELTVRPRNEGWVARAHQTSNTWVYGDPILGAIDPEPMKAFTAKGMSIPLASLADGAKSLPKGQSYAYTLEGQFEVSRGGDYGMAVEITAKTPAKGVVIGGLSWQHDVCATSLLIDGETVVEKDGRVGKERYNENVFSILGSGKVNLAPGIHTIKAAINCAMPAYNKGFGAMWTLKVRGPSAVEPTLPTSSFVFHEKPDTTI